MFSVLPNEKYETSLIYLHSLSLYLRTIEKASQFHEPRELRKDPTMENKRRLQEEIRVRMKEWDKQIDLFKIQADRADPESRAKYYKRIHDLETEKLVMKQKLAELEESDGDTWRDISSILEKAAVDFKRTIERAAKYFKREA